MRLGSIWRSRPSSKLPEPPFHSVTEPEYTSDTPASQSPPPPLITTRIVDTPAISPEIPGSSTAVLSRPANPAVRDRAVNRSSLGCRSRSQYRSRSPDSPVDPDIQRLQIQYEIHQEKLRDREDERKHEDRQMELKKEQLQLELELARIKAGNVAPTTTPPVAPPISTPPVAPPSGPNPVAANVPPSMSAKAKSVQSAMNSFEKLSGHDDYDNWSRKLYQTIGYNGPMGYIDARYSTSRRLDSSGCPRRDLRVVIGWTVPGKDCSKRKDKIKKANVADVRSSQDGSSTSSSSGGPNAAPKQMLDARYPAIVDTPISAQAAAAVGRRPEEFLLDWGAQVHVCYLRDYFVQLKPLPRPLLIRGIGRNVIRGELSGDDILLPVITNGSVTTIRVENVVFAPDLGRNIIGLGRLWRLHRVKLVWGTDSPVDCSGNP
ncbi:hypothetical protein FRC06_004475 [Ceratobasidium sp. 370]|nr:hypothetical protein FRC06_004475 [Ceratobasidium sp. 370]